MSPFFPFGYPAWTAFYLSVYVLTLLVHVVFMNYVLAGTAYLAGITVIPGAKGQRLRDGVAARTLRDWMPFALGGAITAGVAPLLFVQVLYKKSFYTANLLLFHGWMSILPVLIVGFYLLYLIKQVDKVRRPLPVRALMAFGAFACIAYVGLGWTQNNVLSLQGESTWAAFYESGAMVYRPAVLWPRLAIWFSGAFPTMILLVAWQVLLIRKSGAGGDGSFVRPAGLGAAAAFGAAALAAVVYLVLLPTDVRAVAFGWINAVYWIMPVVGAGLYLWAWWQMHRGTGFSARGLGLASIGMGIALLGVTAMREIVRLTHLDMDSLAKLHARIAESGGMVWFVVFLAVNTVLITWCIRMVNSGVRPKGQEAEEGIGSTPAI